jgi:cytoskeletal protein CcmA (bactofilin family)
VAADDKSAAIVGRGTRIVGHVAGDEDLVVRGRVEGDIRLGGTLFVEGEGVVVADVSARRVVVAGCVVGQIDCEESLHVGESGRVVGDCAAPRVVLTAGAQIRGQLETVPAGAERSVRAARDARPAPTAARVTVPAARTTVAPAPGAPAAQSRAPAPPPPALAAKVKLKRK